jgi:hypothetical protein
MVTANEIWSSTNEAWLTAQSNDESDTCIIIKRAENYIDYVTREPLDDGTLGPLIRYISVPKHLSHSHLMIFILFYMYHSINWFIYYTEGVFMSPGGTGCIYSTLFDAHIRLIFSRQYHINCLSIQNTYNFIYAYIFDFWPSVSH